MQNRTGHLSRLASSASQLATQIVAALTCVLLFALGLAAAFSSSILDPKNYGGEHILFQRDAWLANVVVLTMALLLTALVGFNWQQRHSPDKPVTRFRNWLDGHVIALATAGLMAWVLTAGLAWVLAVKSIPATDSARVVTAAVNALKGSFETLRASDSYFRLFPFQLGYVAVAELLLRVFGGDPNRTLAIVNVAALALAYLAILRLARQLFPGRRIQLMTIALLATFLQPILASTFLYGNLISLTASLWTCSLALSWMQNGRRRLLLPVALLGSFAVMVKMNAWIVILAITIVLVLHSLQTRRRFGLVIAAATIALCLALPHLALASYERRAGVDLGEGTPQTAWLAMGLMDSTRAPGWYNGYTYSVFPGNDYSGSKTSAKIAADISTRVKALAGSPRTALTFFTRKALSQWNEATFESIWVSQVKNHAGPVPAWVQNVYTGFTGTLLSVWFDLHLQILYLAAAAGLLMRRRISPELALLPLVLLGAFSYHILFEAKSQYALIYLPLLTPYAAYGFSRLSHALADRFLAPSQPRRYGALPQPDTGIQEKSSPGARSF